jgi:hypothetical protein
MMGVFRHERIAHAAGSVPQTRKLGVLRLEGKAEAGFVHEREGLTLRRDSP